jgi:hypothetical protein
MTLTTTNRPTLTGHPGWCAQGHQCGLGEHRSTPVTLDSPTGVVILTRVLAATGREHVEIRFRIGLASGEPHAKAHLTQIVYGLDALLRRVTHRRC